MKSNVDIINDLPFGEPAVWAALYHLAREIDRPKEPTYGPMLEEEEIYS